MKSVLFTLIVAMTLFCVPCLHAQGGCVNSPENPTAILALAGVAGAGISHLRARWKAKKTDQN